MNVITTYLHLTLHMIILEEFSFCIIAICLRHGYDAKLQPKIRLQFGNSEIFRESEYLFSHHYCHINCGLEW